MSFLWRLHGSVELYRVTTDQELLDEVARWLKKQWKPVTERGSDFVVFNDPLFATPFTPNWVALSLFDHGRFWIEHEPVGRTLRYELRRLHGFVFCLFGAGVAFLFGLAVGGLAQGLKYGAVSFAWIYGGNALMSWLRVPAAVRKAVGEGRRAGLRAA